MRKKCGHISKSHFGLLFPMSNKLHLGTFVRDSRTRTARHKGQIVQGWVDSWFQNALNIMPCWSDAPIKHFRENDARSKTSPSSSSSLWSSTSLWDLRTKIVGARGEVFFLSLSLRWEWKSDEMGRYHSGSLARSWNGENYTKSRLNPFAVLSSWKVLDIVAITIVIFYDTFMEAFDAI